ncbi:P-II family nitrogen regulator [Chloroflexota bacterium]
MTCWLAKVLFSRRSARGRFQSTSHCSRRGLQTGYRVDGKVFILPLEGAVRIRTGDRDENDEGEVKDNMKMLC